MKEMKHKILSERAFYRSPGANLILKSTIVGEFNELKLNVALDELRRVNPILTYILKQDDAGDVSLIKEPDRPFQVKLVRKQNSHHWTKLMEHEDNIPFCFEMEPGIRIFILHREEDFDFIILGHHILGDGLSYIYLLQDFLEIYCNNNFTLQVKETRIIAVTQDLPVERSPSSELLEDIESINNEWKNYNKLYTQEEFESMYIKFHENKTNNFHYQTLTQNDFETMKNNCKYHNVTINTAVCTAFLYASNEGSERIHIAVNLRDQLKFNPGKCIGNYAGSISPVLVYQYELDFWENAKIIGSIIKEEINDPKKLLYIPQVFSLLDGTLFDGSFMGALANCNIEFLKKMSYVLQSNIFNKISTVSNVGVASIPTLTQDYQVKDVTYLAPITATMNKALGVVTVGNNMSIGISYVKQVYSEQQITLLAKTMVDILCNRA